MDNDMITWDSNGVEVWSKCRRQPDAQLLIVTFKGFSVCTVLFGAPPVTPNQIQLTLFRFGVSSMEAT